MTDIGFDDETAHLLRAHGFEAGTFSSLQKRLAAGRASPEANRIHGSVRAPEPGDVVPLPPPGSAPRRALLARGAAAIAAGEVGAVVLAGGMATRFGGVVKAAVEVVDGRSFLDVKVADARAAAEAAGGCVPLYLMTSFNTDRAVRALARAASSERVPVEVFSQSLCVRLRPDGEILSGPDGRPSLYAPGHGDLPSALRASGVLSRFRAAGGKVLFMSNVDNVAATLDPAVIGAHLAQGRAMTVECAPKEPGDRGGAPARVDGRLQIVESFRFPESFDQDRIPVFNTNTLIFDAGALDRDFELTWFAVRKQIEGRDAVQFERLVGELTAWLPATYLGVAREGPDGRFQPVKDPSELERRRDAIRAILRARGVL